MPVTVFVDAWEAFKLRYFAKFVCIKLGLRFEFGRLDLTETNSLQDGCVVILGWRPVFHSVPPSLGQLISKIALVPEIDFTVFDLQLTFRNKSATLDRDVRGLHRFDLLATYLLMLYGLNIRGFRFGRFFPLL